MRSSWQGINSGPADIFRIEGHKAEIVDMEGFGEKSFQNLVDSVNRARNTNSVRLLYSLGFQYRAFNAKAICKHFNYDWQAIQSATYDDLIKIYGIGDVIAKA